MGYVYYGNYAVYLEVARVEIMRELGFSYKEMEHDGILMPVLHFEIKYVRPAFYDDLITVTTIVKEMPDRRIHFEYELTNEKQELLSLAKTTLAFVSKTTMKAVRVPEILANLLQPFFK
jgi:acyl-CoA thioester hydrolase